MDKIYLSKRRKKYPKYSKKEFLAWYFKENQPATYNISGVAQCAPGKKRTLKDLTSLLNGMFKTKSTYAQVFKLLIDLTREDKVSHVNCEYVNDLTWFTTDFKGYGRTGYIADRQITQINKKYNL